MRLKVIFLIILINSGAKLYSQDRWVMNQDGGISWNITKGEAHSDNIEMSGRFISVIVTYGVDADGKLITSKQLVFPMLRTLPNDTHASLMYRFGAEAEPVIKINNRAVNEQIQSFSLRGLLTTVSTVNNLTITRQFFPSTDKALAVEKYTIENSSAREVSIDVEDFEKNSRTHREKSLYDIYEVSARTYGAGIYTLKAGEKLSFAVLFTGRKISEAALKPDIDKELKQRETFVDQMFNNLTFHSPDPVINRMFDFAKIRAMESIYETKGGLVHGPGGASYYAAIWANDQAEYANPFFAYTGYPTAIESGLVSWRWFSKYMNPEYKPIPSSIIAEGTDFWNGAGDRGDMAMIAYGASRFALSLGEKEAAEEIWPLIEWCLEYCRRKINADGVVSSDSDELEGRFPAGKANLCTSSLFYDALNSAAYLGKDLGKSPKLIASYIKMAKELHENIEKYFGATMDDFETYRYYDGNDLLRSWICIPLTVGIFDRAQGTIDALFSPKLWTDQGLLTQEGSTTFWDRSTLYGLRGVISAGAREKGLKYLTYYSTHRLLGDHVPYAVEAWPEGNQRHLSAESALYCRVITEGLFGFRPTGLYSFQLKPQLPDAWDEMALNDIIAFDGRKIDIKIQKKGEKVEVSVRVDDKPLRTKQIQNGTLIDIKL